METFANSRRLRSAAQEDKLQDGSRIPDSKTTCGWDEVNRSMLAVSNRRTTVVRRRDASNATIQLLSSQVQA